MVLCLESWECSYRGPAEIFHPSGELFFVKMQNQRGESKLYPWVLDEGPLGLGAWGSPSTGVQVHRDRSESRFKQTRVQPNDTNF